MFNGLTRLLTIIAMFILVSNFSYSQEDQIPVRNDQYKKPVVNEVHKLDLGVGFGMDYGGIMGVQIGYVPVKHLTLFAAGGYYLYEFGWLIGLKGLFIPKTIEHAFRPYLKAAYGTNSVISAEGVSEYNKVYKGFVIGFGMEFRFGKKKQNGFDLDLNVPLRTPDFWEDYNAMKNDPRLDVIAGPIPIAFSIGYHHEF